MSKTTVRATVVVALLATGFALYPRDARSNGWSWRTVIVSHADGTPAAAAAVRSAGGAVIRALPIVDGVEARIPASAAAWLAARPGIRGVADDERVRVTDNGSGASGDSLSAPWVVNDETGADRVWAGGHQGAGVRVALIDTGIANVADLAGRVVPVPDPANANSIVACANFSGEPDCSDSYGHGTFVAGLIAGNGSMSHGLYRGAAPKADLVSVKIAGRDGSADVTKVLAAIQWVVSFKDQLHIRVLNLSLGTDSHQRYEYDPLNYAVERAWDSGIVVVVAASNLGPGPGTISKPGDDPLVVTVGAVDDRGTPGLGDDRLPDFSGRGPTASNGLAKPDLVAPGARVISLRAPGSYIEQEAPGGGVDANYRRGSGTSMSTGVVSGLTALLAEIHPDWSPDRVKFAVMSTAKRVASFDPNATGSGLPDVSNATVAPPGLANTGVTVLSDASGSLQASRGTVRVTQPCNAVERTLDPQCDYVHDNQTSEGRTFDANQYANSSWDGMSWYSSQWGPTTVQGYSWFGSSWFGYSWFGYSWFGSSWYGTEDQGSSYGKPIAGSAWYGAWL